MPNPSAAQVQHATKPSLSALVRDSIVLSEGLIVECVNEVLNSLEPHRREFFRRHLKSTPGISTAIMRVTVDMGVILSLAKSFESDDEFADSAGLVHDIDFRAHDGFVGSYAKAMVECDLNSIAKAEAGEMGQDAVLYDLIPTDVLERRLRLLLSFMNHAMHSAH